MIVLHPVNVSQNFIVIIVKKIKTVVYIYIYFFSQCEKSV